MSRADGWIRETIEVPQFGAAEFFRKYAARLGSECSLVIGPTTDGRVQLRSGTHKQTTLEISERGDFHGTADTVKAAKKQAEGWLHGA